MTNDAQVLRDYARMCEASADALEAAGLEPAAAAALKQTAGHATYMADELRRRGVSMAEYADAAVEQSKEG